MRCGSKVELVNKGLLPEELVSFYTGKVNGGKFQRLTRERGLYVFIDSDDSSVSQEVCIKGPRVFAANS